jgi:hypothetical protein
MPAGSALSPLLWSLVVDELLWSLMTMIIAQQDMQMTLQP